MTDQLTRTDPPLLRLNLPLLLVVVFLPFPTGLVADALHNKSGERVHVAVFGLAPLASRLLGFALDAYARHEHLYHRQGGEELHSTWTPPMHWSCLPGGIFIPGIQKDRGAVRAHRDTVTEPPAHVVFHLILAQRVN